MIDACTLFGSWSTRKADTSLDALLRIMADHQVDRFLSLSTTGVFYEYEEGNQETLQHSKRHPQIIPVATVDLRKYFGGKHIVARLRDQGFAALRLFPDLQGWPLQYEPFHAILAELAHTQMPLILPAAGLGAITQAARLAEPHGVPLILSGVNYSHLAEALAVMQRSKTVFVETSLLDTPDGYELFVREVGADRLLFGSNAPLHYFSSAFLTLQRAQISPTDKRLILGRNIERLLSG